jgi:hypothetical protein
MDTKILVIGSDPMVWQCHEVSNWFTRWLGWGVCKQGCVVGNEKLVRKKCAAAIIDRINDNEIGDAIFVLTINLRPLFFDLGKSRAFYLPVANHAGCQ